MMKTDILFKYFNQKYRSDLFWKTIESIEFKVLPINKFRRIIVVYIADFLIENILVLKNTLSLHFTILFYSFPTIFFLNKDKG